MKVNPDWIFYLEDLYYPDLNKFIQKNRKRIDRYIRKNRKADLRFFYFPEIRDIITPEILQYSNPFLSESETRSLFDDATRLTTPEFTSMLLKNFGYEEKVFPGLFRYNNHPQADPDYEYTKIKGNFPAQWKSFFKQYFERQERSYDEELDDYDTDPFYQIRYKLSLSPEQEKIEKKFQEKGNELPREALNLMKKIEDPGQIELIRQFVDSKLRQLESESKLSRIIINKDEIRLPDYSDMKIHLTPLQKTVYVLFMNHEEGIDLQKLPEYKDEMMEIYLKLSNRGLLDHIKSSVEALTDPLDNSIHEKLSRIKSAFVSHFHDSLASYYYITGAKAQLKTIAIDRNLVDLEI